MRGRSRQRCGWQPSPCTHLTAAVTLRRSLEVFECWFWITRRQSHKLRGSRHSFSVTFTRPSFSFQMAPNLLTSLSLQGPSTLASSTLCPPLWHGPTCFLEVLGRRGTRERFWGISFRVARPCLAFGHDFPRDTKRKALLQLGPLQREMETRCKGLGGNNVLKTGGINTSFPLSSALVWGHWREHSLQWVGVGGSQLPPSLRGDKKGREPSRAVENCRTPGNSGLNRQTKTGGLPARAKTQRSRA